MRLSGMACRAACAGALLACAWAGEAPPLTRITWPIPAVAWRVPIGRADRGVPLGGLGAGSLMLNSAGTFGPCQFLPGSLEEQRRLAGAAFHFYEKPEGQPARTTTLTAASPMPAWQALPPNSGFYHALFPKAWFTYRCFTADLSLKVFTPIARLNTKETSYPAAVFEFVVANPTDKPLDVGLLLSFPNAAARAAELRTGFMNFVEEDPEERLAAVVLDARSPYNPPASEDSEWCIAVHAEKGGEVSCTSSWNAMASGGDLLQAFAAEGRLPNKPLDATDSAAAVAFHATLAPKATVTVPFVLSWDFPRLALGPTQWLRRYTDYFGRTSNASYTIAHEALLHHAEWEAAVDAWTRPVLDEPAYPDWLKQAALNELYFVSFGGTFWEAGCLTAPREFKGLHPEDHKFFTVQAIALPYCEPLAARPPLALWPSIEQDVLAAYSDAILDAPTPVVSDLGTPSGNPFFAYNARPETPPKAKDLPALFILQAHAHWRASGDAKFLEHVWPACRKSYEALRAACGDDAIPVNEGDDTVSSPCPLKGVSLLCGGLWVAALEALQPMALAREDPIGDEVRRLLPLARANLDKLLWQPEARCYALDTGSPYGKAIASGALAGLRYAQAAGLPSILPAERVRDHLRQVFLRCVKPLRDYTGDGVGDVGAANAVGPDGKPPAVGLCGEVSVAATYRLAATMYHAGREAGDEALMADALHAAYGAFYQTWFVAPDKALWAFNTPQAWLADNPARARATQSIEARAIWDLLLAIKNPYAEPPVKE